MLAHRLRLLSFGIGLKRIRFNPNARRSIARPEAFSRATFSVGNTNSNSQASEVVDKSRRQAITPEFWKEIKDIHDEDIYPLNDRLYGPVDKYSDTVTQLPFVFCLGNHSSGKSTFINYLLGRDVQNTGVAPTDDSFTIIAPGPDDVNQDGASVVGDVDFGFSGLRRFGLHLLNHLTLKVRRDINVHDIMVIDSPGMIDNPAGRYTDSTPESELQRNMDRGYNFPDVTRWLAARADVVLLFFDPDKPGTTGETLACMTHSLKGVEHKLHIILNKADQFEKMHDFARAYGALCWNLSKVIPRKDLPRIYTMCLPVEGHESHPGGLGINDLKDARDAVVAEALAAPERRLDNTLTWLYDSSRLLDMHCTMLAALSKQWRWEQLKHGGAATGVVAIGQLIAIGGGTLIGHPEFAIAISGVSFLSGIGVFFALAAGKARRVEELVSEDGLTMLFRRTYHRELSVKNEFVSSLWDRALPCLKTAIDTVGVSELRSNLPSRRELRRLREICEDDVPRLRKVVAPTVNFW